MQLLTTSVATLMSAQSSLNSHTSRNKISDASARALASSAVRILKRSTTSSPYRDTNCSVAASCALLSSSLKLFWVFGKLHIFLMIASDSLRHVGGVRLGALETSYGYAGWFCGAAVANGAAARSSREASVWERIAWACLVKQSKSKIGGTSVRGAQQMFNVVLWDAWQRCRVSAWRSPSWSRGRRLEHAKLHTRKTNHRQLVSKHEVTCGRSGRAIAVSLAYCINCLI